MGDYVLEVGGFWGVELEVGIMEVGFRGSVLF